MGAPRNQNHITDKERIPILLAEYNTLRAEMMQRYTGFVSFITISIASGVTIVGVVSLQQNPRATQHAVILGVCLFMFLIIVGFVINRDFFRLAAHLRRLENKINMKAGERLLTWETDHGRPPEIYFRPVVSPFRSLKPMVRIVVRSSALLIGAKSAVQRGGKQTRAALRALRERLRSPK